jgi:hypothetical protein
MKVRLLTDRAQPTLRQRRGTEIDVDKDEARRLIESGAAEPIAEKRADKRETR